MRTEPFSSRAEVDSYLGQSHVQCLECGRWFRNLGKHLVKTHEVAPDAYRAKWGIPQGRGLVGTGTRLLMAEHGKKLHADGLFRADFAAKASRVAKERGRGSRAAWERQEHSSRVARTRPGDSKRLPDGSRRQNGVDADRAREYQRAYRAMKTGNDALMQAYRKRWAIKSPI